MWKPYTHFSSGYAQTRDMSIDWVKVPQTETPLLPQQEEPDCGQSDQ